MRLRHPISFNVLYIPKSYPLNKCSVKKTGKKRRELNLANMNSAAIAQFWILPKASDQKESIINTDSFRLHLDIIKESCQRSRRLDVITLLYKLLG